MRAVSSWVLSFTVALALVLPGPVVGQDDSPESSDAWRPQGWGLVLGVARQGVSDQIASPLRYRGTGLDGGLLFRRSSPESAWRVELLAELARPESKIVRSGGGWEDLYRASLSFTYLRTVGWLRDRQVQLYLGGRIGAVAQYREHQYWPSRSEQFGDAVFPLELAGRWDLSLNADTRFEHRISVPLVSLVLRTPYSGLKYVPDLRLAGPGTARGFSSRAVLTRRITERMALGLFHRIAFFRYPDPLPVSWVGHGVGLQLEILP